jgi:hypothetical protein
MKKGMGLKKKNPLGGERVGENSVVLPWSPLGWRGLELRSEVRAARGGDEDEMGGVAVQHRAGWGSSGTKSGGGAAGKRGFGESWGRKGRRCLSDHCRRFLF